MNLLVDRRVLLLLSVLFSVAYASLGNEDPPVKLDDVVTRNTVATGGRAAIEAVKTIAVDLHIVDPGFEVDGTYLATRPNQMRIDVKANGKAVYVEAFDGKRAWQWKGEGTTTVEESPTATAALRRGIEFPGKLYGLHELAGHGHTLELAGREKIDGIDYYAIKASLNDGFKATFYIDPNTWLITRRRDVRPLHVDIDPTSTTIEHRSSDFQKVNGVTYAFHSEEIDLQTGKVLENDDR